MSNPVNLFGCHCTYTGRPLRQGRLCNQSIATGPLHRQAAYQEECPHLCAMQCGAEDLSAEACVTNKFAMKQCSAVVQSLKCCEAACAIQASCMLQIGDGDLCQQSVDPVLSCAY